MSEQRFDSVWDAIEDRPAEAANMKARSDLVIAIREVVESWRVTQAEAHPAGRAAEVRNNPVARR